MKEVLTLAAVLAVSGIILMQTGPTSGDDAVHPTAEEAAHGGFKLFHGDALGNCESISPPPDPDEDDFCYTTGWIPDDGTFAVYSTHYYGIADADSWLGVALMGEGWKSYGAGPCSVFYCRITNPAGDVIEGTPDGDMNCDDVTDSGDALAVLQYVAGLAERPVCSYERLDRRYGLTATDALIILQADAGLIPGLPLPFSASP
jgi:hypothetical protein